MKYKDYPLPDLYTTPPSIDPSLVNWKSIMIYTGISVTCIVVLSVAIHYSAKSNLKLVIAQSNKVNKDLMDIVDRHNSNMEAITKASLQKQSPLAFRQEF